MIGIAASLVCYFAVNMKNGWAGMMPSMSGACTAWEVCSA